MRLLSNNQKECIEKLHRLKVGALFMGCGTGKTQTAVALINSVSDIDFVLWVAPLRTIDNLKAEIALCECEHEVKFYGIESIGQSGRIFLEVMALCENKNVFIVCDESIKIKNLRAVRTKRMFYIGDLCKYKLILNGTPVTKNIMDIYAQMKFLSPKILNKDFYKFRDDYCCYNQLKVLGRVKKTYITGYANVEHLLSLIEPYVYECSLDLSLNKKYSTIKWRMSAIEGNDYYDLKMKLINEIVHEDSVEFLGMLQKLQHSYSLSEDKLDKIKYIVDDKTIIYVKFLKTQEQLQNMFPDALVMTYGKGSFGLNLQKYNRIIYFDKTFDYAHREQSEARIYRTGQQNDCEYIDLTGDVGLEKLFDKCIDKKIGLVEAFKVSGLKLEQL